MQSMETYGTSLIEYEGDATVSYHEGPTFELECQGRFEAKQLPGGRVTIAFFPNEVSAHGAGSADGEQELSLIGTTTHGWQLSTIGQILFSRWELILLPATEQPTELSFSPRLLRARSTGASLSGYERVRFLTSNFLWHPRSDLEPEPMELSTRDFRVVVTPISGYLQVAERIKNFHGIEPTAEVEISTWGGEVVTLERYTEFMTELVYPFRLATGNAVNWYYVEASQHEGGPVVERVHQYAITNPFSNTLQFKPLPKGYRSGVPKLRFQDLVKSFLGGEKRVLEPQLLKQLTNYFVAACDDTNYLEPRGLLASTLTELITAKFAKAKGFENVLDKNVFETQVLPNLREAVSNVDRGDVSAKLWEELKRRAEGQLLGAFRRSFRQRLKRLTDDLSLTLDSKGRDRLVSIRNSLVHDGTFPSNFEDGGWQGDYRLAIWTNLTALCRLAGYDGELPIFFENDRLLEV